MKPERLNYREREIASMYGIALKKLREYRHKKIEEHNNMVDYIK